MADIINFQKYVEVKDEEKKRIRQVSILLSKRRDVEGLLHNINNSTGCSIVTRYRGQMNPIAGKENINILDSATLDVIINSLKDYNNKICEQIKELNSVVNRNNIIVYKM